MVILEQKYGHKLENVLCVVRNCIFLSAAHFSVWHIEQWLTSIVYLRRDSNIFLRFYYGGRVTHPCRATVASSDIMHDVRFICRVSWKSHEKWIILIFLKHSSYNTARGAFIEMWSTIWPAVDGEWSGFCFCFVFYFIFFIQIYFTCRKICVQRVKGMTATYAENKSIIIIMGLYKFYVRWGNESSI